MQTKILKTKFAANITHCGFTYNTILMFEYKHTGKLFFYKKKGQKTETYTDNPLIAEEKKAEGLKVREEEGYYFIDRIAMPTINAKGEKDIWYDNDNEIKINKISKYGRKVHNLLANNINPF